MCQKVIFENMLFALFTLLHPKSYGENVQPIRLYAIVSL